MLKQSKVRLHDHPTSFHGVECCPANEGCTEASEQAAKACREALFLTDPHVDRESVISTKVTMRHSHDREVVLEAFRLDAGPSHLEMAQKCLDCMAQKSLWHKFIDLDAKLNLQETALFRSRQGWRWCERTAIDVLAAEVYAIECLSMRVMIFRAILQSRSDRY